MPHWAVELARFPLVAGGGERSAPNMLQLFLFSFMLGLRLGGGGKISSPRRVQKSLQMSRDAT
jgi:hypothetical protein